MRRTILLLAATMSFAMLVIGGVAYALTVQCDDTDPEGNGTDQDPDPGECAGTSKDDFIAGTGGNDTINARAGFDEVDGNGGEEE
jgi:hypothetical protein